MYWYLSIGVIMCVALSIHSYATRCVIWRVVHHWKKYKMRTHMFALSRLVIVIVAWPAFIIIPAYRIYKERRDELQRKRG